MHLLADGVHLFAHDGDDLVDGARAEEELRIQARAKLANVSGAEQKSVAGDLGVCRRLTKSRNEKL